MMELFANNLIEAGRLAALRRYEFLDTPREAAFDRVTMMTALRFNVPVSVISLVDENRIWFKSSHGIDVSETGRELGLCATTVLCGKTRILADARLDEVASLNPLVRGPLGVRFYAGAPLLTADGHCLGTLSAIDVVPRKVDPALLEELEILAALVVDQMELRLAASKALVHADLMAREIDHRVMNSLQFISNVLALQSRQKLNIADASRQLEMAACRIASIAKVHRHFHARSAGETTATDFLSGLCADLSKIIGQPIEAVAGPVLIKEEWLQPLALIINELVTNAGKYGGARIVVSLVPVGSGYELCVRNTGPGLAADFNPNHTGGLGMKVVLGLTRQLGGILRWSTTEDGTGACFTVTV